MAFEPGNYFLKRSGSVIAFVRFTTHNVYLTPKKLSGAELVEIQTALEADLCLPGDLTMVPMQVAAIQAENDRPCWSEMLVTSSKRQKWLDRKKLSIAS